MKPTILNSQTKWAFLASFVITAVFTFLQTVLHIQIEEAIIHWVIWFVDGVFVLLGIYGMRNAQSKIQNEFYQSSASIPKDGQDLTTKPYGSKTLQSILIAFTLSALLTGSVVITGCSSNQVCFSCGDKALSWQGNILGLTSGRYIETACFKLDLFKIISNISAGEISWTDLTKSIKVEVVIKDGEFCDPNDASYYKVTLQSDEADADKKVIFTKKEAIILKEEIKNP